MKYKVLDINSVINYLFEIDSVMEYFGDDNLEAEEIGDGNLNFVFIVRSINDRSKAVIVKQAVPYLRCVGESFPLSRDRMTYEIRALKRFFDIAPSYVPKIFYSSEEMSLVVMQYLDDHIIMRKGLIDKNIYPSFAEHISKYLANTLFFTSSLYLQSDQKRELIDKFNGNTELCKLTEDFVFTFAFMENETNDLENIKGNSLAVKLFKDMEFKEKVLDLKYKFMIQTDALIHGDLHTGSIMLNEKETFVIDPEFAFVGPFGFDIGALLANLVNSYIHHTIVTKDEEYKSWILKTIEEFMEMFDEKFFDLWETRENSALIVDGFIDDSALEVYKNRFSKNIMRDSVGFAGCKMTRRVFGVAGVEEIRGIADKDLRAKAEEMALSIGREFVIQYDKIETVEDIIKIIKGKSAR